MTNPDREELVKLADEAARWKVSDIKNPDDVRAFAADVESALRRLASSDGAVKGEPEPVAWLRYATEGDAPTPCNEDDDGAFAVYRTAPPADAGMRWRHKKRGSTYTEIGRGTMQCSANALIDMQPVVIYRSEHDGSLWVRGVVEFEDGRFEALTAPGATFSKRQMLECILLSLNVDGVYLNSLTVGELRRAL